MAFTSIDDRRKYHRDYYAKKTKPERERKNIVEDRLLPVHLRLKSSLVGRIVGLFHSGVAKGTTSHKTPSQFYADLLFRGLETLTGEEDVDEAIQYLRAVSALDSIGTHRKEAQAAFSRVKIELLELLQIDAKEPAIAHYWTTRKAFEDMSENVWNDWFLSKLAKTFPQLHKAHPKSVTLDASMKTRKARLAKLK